MSRAVKLTVSVPEPVFKELEALRRKTSPTKTGHVPALGPKIDAR